MDRYFIGMDIGGTNVRIALMNAKGELVGSICRFKSVKGSSALDEVENNICLPLMRFLDDNKVNSDALYGLGISLAALFDRKSGNITKWPNNRLWDLFPLKSYLEKRLQISIMIEDDANSAALGEHLMGAGKGFTNFAYVTISTGIGCGLILNNSLYTGSKGWAGEIGHIKISKDGPLCTCGAAGCLQALVSGPALYKKCLETVASHSNITIDAIDNLEQVAQLAKRGEGWAVKIFEYAGEYLAWMFSNMIMLLDISLIVVGGGVSQAGEVLLDPIRRELNFGIRQFDRQVAVETAKLGDNSGVIGALSLIYKRCSGDA